MGAPHIDEMDETTQLRHFPVGRATDGAATVVQENDGRRGV
jgi:hypothetical protein